MFDAALRFRLTPFFLKVASSVVFASAVLAIRALTPTPALAWQISANCTAAGEVVGAVRDVSGPFPSTFDVFVEDHSPVDDSWAQVPGSRVTVVAISASVDFGPLNISAHRAGADLIRIEESATGEHSTPFALCSTPRATATATRTAMPVATNTAQPTNTSQATSTAVATTGGNTNTVGSITISATPSPTGARVAIIAVPSPSGVVLSVVVTPAAGFQPRALPNTGTGPKGDARERSLFARITSLAAGLAGITAFKRQRRWF